MNISKEELERIKQSNKAKDLKSIIAEEKDKKDKDDDTDGGDQNFISDMANTHTVSETKSAIENICQKLKGELQKVTKTLREAVRPVNTELRSLDKEVGGLEANYKKIAKKIDNDKDVWDKRAASLAKEAQEIEVADKSESESFIHNAKTKKGKKRKKHMGPVDLDSASENRPTSYVEKVKKSRQDQSYKDGISL